MRESPSTHTHTCANAYRGNLLPEIPKKTFKSIELFRLTSWLGVFICTNLDYIHFIFSNCICVLNSSMILLLLNWGRFALFCWLFGVCDYYFFIEIWSSSSHENKLIWIQCEQRFFLKWILCSLKFSHSFEKPFVSFSLIENNIEKLLFHL